MDRKEELIEYLYHATEIDTLQAKLDQIKIKVDELTSKVIIDLTEEDIKEAKALQKETLDIQAIILEHQAELKEFLRKELN